MYHEYTIYTFRQHIVVISVIKALFGEISANRSSIYLCFGRLIHSSVSRTWHFRFVLQKGYIKYTYIYGSTANRIVAFVSTEICAQMRSPVCGVFVCMRCHLFGLILPKLYLERARRWVVLRGNFRSSMLYLCRELSRMCAQPRTWHTGATAHLHRTIYIYICH